MRKRGVSASSLPGGCVIITLSEDGSSDKGKRGESKLGEHCKG